MLLISIYGIYVVVVCMAGTTCDLLEEDKNAFTFNLHEKLGNNKLPLGVAEKLS